MNKVEILIRNYTTEDECSFLVDFEECTILKESFKQEESEMKGLITEGDFGDEVWDIVDLLETKGYGYTNEYSVKTRIGTTVASHFGEDCPIMLFETQRMDIMFDRLNKMLSNLDERLIIRKGDSRK